jgi:hypothetical protein
LVGDALNALEVWVWLELVDDRFRFEVRYRLALVSGIMFACTHVRGVHRWRIFFGASGLDTALLSVALGLLLLCEGFIHRPDTIQ